MTSHLPAPASHKPPHSPAQAGASRQPRVGPRVLTPQGLPLCPHSSCPALSLPPSCCPCLRQPLAVLRCSLPAPGKGRAPRAPPRPAAPGKGCEESGRGQGHASGVSVSRQAFRGLWSGLGEGQATQGEEGGAAAASLTIFRCFSRHSWRHAWSGWGEGAREVPDPRPGVTLAALHPYACRAP